MSLFSPFQMQFDEWKDGTFFFTLTQLYVPLMNIYILREGAFQSTQA